MEKPKMEIRAEPALWADHSFRMYAEAYRQGLVALGNEGFHKAQVIWTLIDCAMMPLTTPDPDQVSTVEQRAWLILYSALDNADPTFQKWWEIYKSTKLTPDKTEDADIKKMAALKRVGRFAVAILIGVIIGKLIAVLV